MYELSLPQVRGRYRYQANLGKMCWFGVGGEAEVLFIPADILDLQHFLQNIAPDIPITVIGVGSNLLVRDGGVKGVVIRFGTGFNYIEHDEYNIKVGAAVLDINVAQYCAAHNITGLEFLAGIPGTIGGALFMNAGAYGNEIAGVLLEAKVIDLKGNIRTLKNAEIGYQYRGNSLKEKLIFVEALLKGIKSNGTDIIDNITKIQEKRIATQPIKSKTGGSTFQNPPGIAAWRLIDEAGCRGLQIGGAQVSKQHCNFFINNGNATAADLENLIEKVAKKVLARTGVLLTSEIKIIGKKNAKDCRTMSGTSGDGINIALIETNSVEK